MRFYWFLLLTLGFHNPAASELLGRISEDDVPLVQTMSPDASPLTYRVICSTEQTDEPDCLRPPVEDQFESLQLKSSKQTELKPQSQSELPRAEPSLDKQTSQSAADH